MKLHNEVSLPTVLHLNLICLGIAAASALLFALIGFGVARILETMSLVHAGGLPSGLCLTGVGIGLVVGMELTVGIAKTCDKYRTQL